MGGEGSNDLAGARGVDFISQEMKSRSGPRYELRPRIRVLRGETIVLGPGKVDLLQAIAETEELRAAARRLGMSYMRAWTLLRTMNRAFGRPLVETHRGGPTHGVARLTPTGRRTLTLYRQMERASAKACAAAWLRLESLLPG
jgi:molybdate transport system regulatory protein